MQRMRWERSGLSTYFACKDCVWNEVDLVPLTCKECVHVWNVVDFGCLSGPPGFTCWISFAPVFSFIYCWVLIFAFISLLYLDLYVLGDGALIHVSYRRCLSRKPNIYVGWSTPELRVRFALLNRFKPSSKIFYWPFQGGTSFVDLLCFCSVLCLLCLCARLFICALWSPAGKGLTSWLSFVVSAVSMSLSHWYPGSGVVLNCIDSSSLHPYLLSTLGLQRVR